VKNAVLSQGAAAKFLRRIPVWVYLALLAAGIVVVADEIYQWYTSAEAAKAYAQTVNDLLRSPIAGMTYDVNVFRWAPTMTAVPSNGPLTTWDSYSFEVSPQGSDCAQSPIRDVNIEFLSPAFDVEPENRISIDMVSLQHNYCVASANQTTPRYHWDVLARQEGHHVVALRIVGLDENHKEVVANTIEVPVIVSDTPFTLAGIVGSLGALGGLVGLGFNLADRFSRRRQRDT
jgi:hypothetical protein